MRMSKWRHAADRKARYRADKIRIGPAYRFTCIFANTFLIDTVRPAGQYKDRFVRSFPFEYQRFDYLSQGTAGALRGLLRSACTFLEFNHVASEPKRR